MLHWILNAVKNYVIKAALKADKTTRQKMSTNANFQKKSIGMKIQKTVWALGVSPSLVSRYCEGYSFL